jgi:hypothetical protein
MTANIVFVLVFDPGARTGPDRLLSVGYWLKRLSAQRPVGAGMLMATSAETVKETGISSPIPPVRLGHSLAKVADLPI